MLVKGNKRVEVSAPGFYADRDISVPNANEVICVLASAKILSQEALNGEAKVSYRVSYKVIYNGENGIDCHEENWEEYVSVKSAGITAGSRLDLYANVVSAEHVGVKNLKARATVEIKGYAVLDYHFEPLDAPEGILAKTLTVAVENIESIKESEIIASLDFEYREVIDRILTHDTKIIINSVASATEMCEVRGECITYVTYLSNGGLCSKTLITPFDAEILTPGIFAGQKAHCFGRASASTLTLSSDGNSSAIKTEIVVGIRGFAVSTHDAEILNDAYSCQKELEIKYQEAFVEDNICVAGATEKLFSTLRIPVDKPKIRAIQALLTPSIVAINAFNAGGGLTAEGIVGVPVVYLDENEKLQTEKVEIPFHFIATRDFRCGRNISANATIVSIACRVKHNDELEFSGEISVNVHASGERGVKYIEQIREIGEREQSDAAISLYIVKAGETLWDVAKALMSDEENLLKLNPDVKLPLIGGEKVLLFREIE